MVAQWSGQICWIMDYLFSNQIGQRHSERDGEPAAVAATESDLWHSNYRVKYSVDVKEELIEE